MPIYEYECSKCGRFECVQKVSEKALNANPECTDPSCPKNAKRVVSAPAFHLKGTGWYKTDYSSGSSGSTSSSSGSSAGSSDSSSSSSDSGSDSKKKKASESAPKSGGCGSKCGCH